MLYTTKKEIKEAMFREVSFYRVIRTDVSKYKLKNEYCCSDLEDWDSLANLNSYKALIKDGTIKEKLVSTKETSVWSGTIKRITKTYLAILK